jgi:DNA repair ATPase RecN
MGVPILPVLSALSHVASSAWDTYSKIKRSRESLPEGSAIASRLETLENSLLEQAEMLSEVSKDLDQFAQAIQAEVERIQRRQTVLTWISCISLAAAAAAIGMFLLLR